MKHSLREHVEQLIIGYSTEKKHLNRRKDIAVSQCDYLEAHSLKMRADQLSNIIDDLENAIN